MARVARGNGSASRVRARTTRDASAAADVVPAASVRARTMRGGSAADAELAAIAAAIRAPGGASTIASKRASRSTRGAARSTESAFDIVAPARPIAMELIGGRGHYERVLAAVLEAKVSVWIATANVKELMVEDRRARPGRRRSLKKSPYVSVLAHLDELAARGVELRLLHAEIPSRPFREEIAQHPRLLDGGLALRRCPRVHLKIVIVDGELLYLGSANWTGAGLGAKGSGRRNFELGFITDDGQLLDQVQGLYEHLWSGGECDGCRLRDDCPGPLVELAR